MTRYVAFLRAINVGGNRKVPMGDLSVQLAALGLHGIATYINSGNVIFESRGINPAELERRIEVQLQQAFGFDVPTLVRTADELAAVNAADPFGAAADHEDATVYVAFLRTVPDADHVRQLDIYQSDIDTLQVEGRHVFWLRRRDLGESAITLDRLERALGTQATIRNMTTLARMVDKFNIASA
jgi:uncharacterized protein (DUF1697 family)